MERTHLFELVRRTGIIGDFDEFAQIWIQIKQRVVTVAIAVAVN